MQIRPHLYLYEIPYVCLNSACYRPQRSCGQGNVFTGVCLSTGGGRVSASVHAGMTDSPDQAPGRHTPRDQTDTNDPADRPRPGRHPPRPGRPPGPGRPPRLAQTPWTRQTPPDQADPTPKPPWTRQTPPPQKQTPAYGLRAASRHPTGMHSCVIFNPLFAYPLLLAFTGNTLSISICSMRFYFSRHLYDICVEHINVTGATLFAFHLVVLL